ncbi:MAG TPA: cytochrome d ubiquinol oxidase subunit II [Armatimonadota bacterium]|jgi:cytochrome d ubiquinol oxidase subunit II
MDLNLFWFILMGVLMTGYAILDGFDLGVGVLHLFTKSDLDRRIVMNSIAPVWDGNEVWLVTFGGALFAAFPNAYATAFSGFYLAFMLLLFALILRAVALEFRGKQEHGTWRQFWDVAFFISSALSSILFGVAVGNMIKGIKVGPDMEYAGGFFDLLHPYPILVGLLTLALFAMHGSIYLYLKTEGDLQQQVRGWFWWAFGAFVGLFLATTVFTLVSVPTAINNFRTFPTMWGLAILNGLAIANIPRAIVKGMPRYAFVSSACTIAALVSLFGMALFPNLIASSINPSYSLTIYSAASSQKTLGIMAIIAALGMPFVLSYTAAIYWVFRGKVKVEHLTY